MNEMNVDELYQKHKENYKAVGDHIKNLAEKHKANILYILYMYLFCIIMEAGILLFLQDRMYR